MKFFRSLFLMRNLFAAVGIVVGLFILGSFVTGFLFIANMSLCVLFIAILIEIVMLYKITLGIDAVRDVANRLSNGDDNDIYIVIENNYAIKIYLQVIDELPSQFQARDKTFFISIAAKDSSTIKYTLRPTKRGTYEFGKVNIYASR